MAKEGPILIIDDDPDDHETLIEVFKEIQVENKILNFTKSSEAFTYLKTTTEKPFLIFCDVNLPGQNGVEFKRQIDEDKELRRKSIPFIFYSTSVDQKSVNTAYTEMTVQGFFKKENTYKAIKEMISLIISYWTACKHPNLS